MLFNKGSYKPWFLVFLLILGLGTRMSDPCLDVVFWTPK